MRANILTLEQSSVTRKIVSIAILMHLILNPRIALAANLEIDVAHEIALKDGWYLAREHEGQGRYALISHTHGRFEGADVMLAECQDGYMVSQLPAKFSMIKSLLKPNDYILTFCRES